MTTTAIAPSPVISDEDLITTLVASHGSITLAAERLHLTGKDILDRLPTLDYTTLSASIKTMRLLAAFDSFTIMKDVVTQTLPDLTPNERAKFLLQFMDRFEAMLNPPVQGAPSNAFQFNFNSPEALEGARASLASRLINLRTSSPEDLSLPPVGGSDNLPVDDDAGRSIQSALRLGVLGARGAARTEDAVVDLGDPHRTRLG